MAKLHGLWMGHFLPTGMILQVEIYTSIFESRFFVIPLTWSEFFSWSKLRGTNFFLQMGYVQTPKSRTKKSLNPGDSWWMMESCYPTKIVQTWVGSSKDILQPIFWLRSFPEKGKSPKVWKRPEKRWNGVEILGPMFFFDVWNGSTTWICVCVCVFFCQTILYFHLDVWGFNDPNLTRFLFFFCE